MSEQLNLENYEVINGLRRAKNGRDGWSVGMIGINYKSSLQYSADSIMVVMTKLGCTMEPQDSSISGCYNCWHQFNWMDVSIVAATAGSYCTMDGWTNTELLDQRLLHYISCDVTLLGYTSEWPTNLYLNLRV